MLYTLVYSDSNLFLDDLNKTYSQEIYQSNIETLNNADNNKTTNLIIQDFEKLLSDYDDFDVTKLDWSLDDIDDYVYFSRFMKISALYVNASSNDRVLKKNIDDLNSLVQNAEILDKYTSSILLYKHFYEKLDKNNSVIMGVLKNNPPAKLDDTYFRLFRLESSNLLEKDLWKKLEFNYKLPSEKRYVAKIKERFEQYQEVYLEVVKTGSKEKVRKWLAKTNKRLNETRSIWYQTKIIFSTLLSWLKYTLFDIIDENAFHVLQTQELIASLLIGLLGSSNASYIDHLVLMQQYKKDTNTTQ